MARSIRCPICNKGGFRTGIHVAQHYKANPQCGRIRKSLNTYAKLKAYRVSKGFEKRSKHWMAGKTKSKAAVARGIATRAKLLRKKRREAGGLPTTSKRSYTTSRDGAGKFCTACGVRRHKSHSFCGQCGSKF